MSARRLAADKEKRMGKSKGMKAAAQALAACAVAIAGMGEPWAAPALKTPSWAAVDETGKLLAGARANVARPIASITKLMMAMAYLDAKPDMSLRERIAEQDVDTVKKSSSRLPVGTELPRSALMRLALASSENRAASALGRSYPGGMPAMVAAMNAKAKALGLASARFVDATGLSPLDVASARDVAAMALAARAYAPAREAAASQEYSQALPGDAEGPGAELGYKNTNKPLREGWISPTVSKTGYIKEAGRCLGWSMPAAAGKPVGMALLGAPSFKQRDLDELALSSWMGAALSPSAPDPKAGKPARRGG